MHILHFGNSNFHFPSSSSSFSLCTSCSHSFSSPLLFSHHNIIVETMGKREGEEDFPKSLRLISINKQQQMHAERKKEENGREEAVGVAALPLPSIPKTTGSGGGQAANFLPRWGGGGGGSPCVPTLTNRQISGAGISSMMMM